MRAVPWECAFAAFAIAACQINATSAVEVDASSSVERSALSVDCRPILIQHCVASRCGHDCGAEAREQMPPGHLFYLFDCSVATAMECAVVYTSCDPVTGTVDPPTAPVAYSCENDHCGP